MQQHEKNRPQKKKFFFFFFFFFFGGGAGAWVRRIYEKLCLDSPRVANFGRCHAYLGCRNMLLRDFHLPLFVTDKWVKCYCELILGLASLSVIMFMHLPSFCQQNIAKSNGHFSKMDGDLSKHRGFAIQFIQPLKSRLALATGPAVRKQLLSPSFRGCVTEPCDGNTVPFIHAYTLLKSDVTRRDHVVRCHGSHECWFTHRQFHSQFHLRLHSLRITLKSTTLVCMRSSNA